MERGDRCLDILSSLKPVASLDGLDESLDVVDGLLTIGEAG